MLSRLGFSQPTEVQTQSIPGSLAGHDLIVSAETGSGKTGAFGIPLVLKLVSNKKSTGLILTPTRELAHQISDFLRELTRDQKNFLVTSVVGGAEMRKQVKALRRKPRIIVATPGRLNDHIRRRSVDLSSAEYLVLDEGDRMIDMGFAPQLEEILRHLPIKRQTSLFSATLSKKVQSLASKYLKDPQLIQLQQASLPVEAIKQSVVQLKEEDQKEEALIREIELRQGSIVIFFRTKRRTDKVSRRLSKMKFKVELIHGDRSQGQRNRAIQNFKSGFSQILCATDVAARGLDIPNVELVVNYDLPREDEDYVHRIGRTARNGAEGEAISLITLDEGRIWNKLAKKFNIPDAKAREKAGSKRNFTKKRASRRYGRFRGKPKFRKAS